MSDRTYTEEYCSLCRRPAETAGRLIKIPGGLNICADCMQRTMDAVSRMDTGSGLGGFPGVPPMDPSMFANLTGQMGFDPVTGQPAAGGQSAGNRTETTETTPAARKEDAPAGDASAPNTDPAGDGQNGDSRDPATESQAGDGEEDTPEETTGKGYSPFGMPGMPHVQFLNLADLQNMMNPQTQVKKKKKVKKEEQPILSITDIPKPHKIKEQLDQYIVGQDHAKKVISVAVYNHYKRILSEKDIPETDAPETAAADSPEVVIEKSNILLLGPTGCGKTFLVQTLARLLNVPLAMADATSLTEAGYIGDDIESVVSKLLAAADNDVERAEQGIIFVDEIDKIAKKHNANSRDVSGESVQQGMLKLLEGSDVEVPVGASSKNAMVPMTTVNTKNILFICGGAFPDLEDIIKQRLTKKTSMGYAAVLKDSFDRDEDLLGKVTAEDLKKFGMVPEFIGRLPVICSMQKLSEEMLVRILKEPRNAILKQYEKLLELDEVKLEFTDGALKAIAGKAMEKETGARALRSIIEEFMLDVMYEIPKDDGIGTVIITEDYVRGKGSPEIRMRGQSDL